jgi:hypothetical protein
MSKYFKNRFYFRGTSWLGILNTITSIIFNRVLIRHVDDKTRKTFRWSIGKGTDFKCGSYKNRMV